MQTQDAVVKHFESVAGEWKAIYEDTTVYATIHQLRRDMALRWVDELPLLPNETVLEVGCGAGLTTIALARRGYVVDALDVSKAMLDLARSGVEEMGLQSQVTTTLGDVHDLHFQDKAFGLVLALGVIPWLHSANKAIHQMARVLKPGGHLLINADNRLRLNHLLDPMFNPSLAPVRHLVSKCLGRTQAGPSLIHMQSPRQFDRSLAAAGLEKIKGVTLGFGPFSFFRHQFVPNSAGIRLHRRLQGLAEDGVPVLRSTGAQYLVLARKSGS